jgi:hypothetical protein
MNPELETVWRTLSEQLSAAQDKRASLEIQLRETDVEVARLNKALANVAALLGFHSAEDISSLGITDAIRRVVNSAQSRMSAAEVREALSKHGFDLSGYQNPMASIYKILARLQENGELDIEREGWAAFYKAKPRAHRRHRRKTWIGTAVVSNPSDVK